MSVDKAWRDDFPLTVYHFHIARGEMCCVKVLAYFLDDLTFDQDICIF